MTKTRSGRAKCALLGVLLTVAPTTTSAWASTGIPLGAMPLTNLQCATGIVSGWSLTDVARETVVVSADAAVLAQETSAATQGYGGFLLFGAKAPDSLRQTIVSLTRLEPDGLAPMIMSDDEGGGIVRMSNVMGAWPWAQQMGSTMTPAQIAAVGQRVGSRLTSMGLNVDLAPVADVDGRPVWPGATNPDGLRSFGASSTKVAADVIAFAQGLTRAHVLAVVKHFPGLGHATGNTDNGPAATLPWSVLQHSGLVPFRRAIAQGIGAVMMANASVPGLTTWPAGVSSRAVEVLRQQLGFQGLIMSDALGAGAISARHWSVAQASVLALAAGVDQVLGSHAASAGAALQDASLTTAAIVASVEHGTLTRSVLVRAGAHVLAATHPQLCG